MTARIGLFGGSFDPFHAGHFLVARAAKEIFFLNEVVFLPCARSPLKRVPPVASDRFRLSLLRAGLKGQSWAKVSDWEIRQGGVSYTVETMRAWRSRFPRASLFWIMGSDQWELLSEWKDPRELARNLEFLVFPRPHRPRARRSFRMREIPLRLDISSTEIRKRLKKGVSVRGMVLAPVEAMLPRYRPYR
ncbi:MAG: nicotinate (nicotinamide) nucleotide adenylyltransferase [Verrucomicrobia bacterium]|nr:nicotinate (nicotinamide) nucleotide adenylyltransferase [Verrucomicrobiota bacterium]NDF16482.1 nicotinate (nicotinamide) nucleotide adenylyltransferase [Verrucomicrobiota bacterium]